MHRTCLWEPFWTGKLYKLQIAQPLLWCWLT